MHTTHNRYNGLHIIHLYIWSRQYTDSGFISLQFNSTLFWLVEILTSSGKKNKRDHVDKIDPWILWSNIYRCEIC